MLDTNIYDLIVARRGLAERLDRAVLAGEIEILRTRVQDEEIARIPDAARRAAMRRIRSRIVPVSDAAWASTRPPSEDAQIAATAAEFADVLVTEDREMRERAAAHPIEVWRFEELVKFVESL
jgi:predicted nucleic acid-binding protein